MQNRNQVFFFSAQYLFISFIFYSILLICSVSFLCEHLKKYEIEKSRKTERKTLEFEHEIWLANH